LSNERYGVWAAVLNVLNWITIFDIGIGNGLRNRLAEALAIGDFKQARAYVSTSYGAIFGFSLVCSLLMVFCVPMVDWAAFFNARGLPAGELASMMAISVVFALLNWTVSLCNQIFYAHQKASWTGLSQVISQLITLAGLFALGFMGIRSLGAWAALYGGSLVLSNVILSAVFFAKHPEIRPSLGAFDIRKVRSVLSIGLKFFLMQIASLVLMSTSNFIVMQLCGPAEVTPFSIANKLFSVITVSFSIILAPFWSGFTDAWAKQDLPWVKRTLGSLLKVYLLFVAGTALLTVFANPILRAWVGRGQDISLFLICANSAYVCVSCFNVIFASFLNGIGLINISFIISIVSWVAYLPLALCLVRWFGPPGALIASVIVLLLSSVIQPLQTFYVIGGGKRRIIWDRLLLERKRGALE
jgi:O-antigen/teichoic acid export membrane protein